MNNLNRLPTGLSKGVGFIRFDQRVEAERAIQELNGTIPKGSSEPITVKFANNPSSNKAMPPLAYLTPPATRRYGGPIHHPTGRFRYIPLSPLSRYLLTSTCSLPKDLFLSFSTSLYFSLLLVFCLIFSSLLFSTLTSVFFSFRSIPFLSVLLISSVHLSFPFSDAHSVPLFRSVLFSSSCFFPFFFLPQAPFGVSLDRDPERASPARSIDRVREDREQLFPSQTRSPDRFAATLFLFVYALLPFEYPSPLQAPPSAPHLTHIYVLLPRLRFFVRFFFSLFFSAPRSSTRDLHLRASCQHAPTTRFSNFVSYVSSRRETLVARSFRFAAKNGRGYFLLARIS